MRGLKKYQSMSVQAKAAIWFVACSFLQKGISFITVPIFTRLMTTDAYGTYNLYLSWFQILTIITSLNLFYGVLDNGLSKFDNDRDRYVSAIQGLTITLTIGGFVVFVVGNSLWSKFINLSPVFMGLMFIELLVSPALSFWSGRQRFEYAYKKLVFVTLIRSIANPVLGVLLVCVIPDVALGRVIGMVAVEVVLCGRLIFIQFKKGKVFFDKNYWRYALTLAIPMLPHYLAGTVLNQGDRIMIESMIGKSEVAFYSVAYSIGMLIHIFTNAINSAITPWLYGKFKKNDVSGVSKIMNGLLVLIAGISICMMLVSPELVLIFGSGKYIMGQYVIPPVAASVFFIFMYGIFSLPQFYYEKTKFLMIASVSAAVLNVGLNYIFINRFGFIAAGYTTLVCYICYSIGHYFVSTKIVKANLKDQQVFDLKFFIVLSLILIGCAIGVNFIFNYLWLRYSLICLGTIIVLMKRHLIVEYFKEIKKK